MTIKQDLKDMKPLHTKESFAHEEGCSCANPSEKRESLWDASQRESTPALEAHFGSIPHSFFQTLNFPLYYLAVQKYGKESEKIEGFLKEFARINALFVQQIKENLPLAHRAFVAIQEEVEARRKVFNTFFQEGLKLTEATEVTAPEFGAVETWQPGVFEAVSPYEKQINESPGYKRAQDEAFRSRAEVDSALFAWFDSVLSQDDILRDVFPTRGKTKIESRFPSNEAIAMLPNLGADRDLHRSLMTYPHDWPMDANLCLRAFDGKENTVVYQPSEVEKLLRDAPQKALELLEKRFGEIKNETVPDVIDILFHHWHRHHDPKTNAALITAAQICKYRNKVPKGDNLNLHWRALQDAFSMSLRERSGDINAKVFFSETVGEKLGAGAVYAYSPGFMLQYALRGETLYFAPFMEKIWELDPKTNNEAKRIARYIRGDWRMNTEKYLTTESGAARAARYHTWAHILSESGIDVESHRKSKDPKRLIEAAKRAVETLFDMEVLNESGFNIYHRDDRKFAENLPARGALDTWLALRVCLAPAADVREALIETDGKRRAGRERDAKALSTERAKKVLKSKSLAGKR